MKSAGMLNLGLLQTPKKVQILGFLVDVQPIKCVLQPKIAKKFTKTPYFCGSVCVSFKVIDVGTPGKLVSSAWYDTQQVCVYLQPFTCQISRQ